MDAKLTPRAEQLARELAGEASTIDGLNSLLRGLMKSALERMLKTEMDVHLGRKGPASADGPSDTGPNAPPAPGNRRNGHSR
jgi:transposase-like protein